VFKLKQWIFKRPDSFCNVQSSGIFPSDCYQWSFSVTQYINKRRSYIVLNQMASLSSILPLTVAVSGCLGNSVRTEEAHSFQQTIT